MKIAWKDSVIMVAKISAETKRERNRQKRAKIDATTNKYMINLAWGIFVIILLRFVESGYSSANTVLAMPVVMKSMAVVFGVLGIGLLVCGKLNLLTRKDLFYGYGAFCLALMAGSLWIGFFSDIRNFFVGINPALSDVDSRWWISRGPIVFVAIYLVATFIFTAIKVALIEKGKKA